MAQIINVISSATVGAATAKLLDVTDGSVEYTASSKMNASQWVGYMQSGGIVLTQAQYAALDRGE